MFSVCVSASPHWTRLVLHSSWNRQGASKTKTRCFKLLQGRAGQNARRGRETIAGDTHLSLVVHFKISALLSLGGGHRKKDTRASTRTGTRRCSRMVVLCGGAPAREVPFCEAVRGDAEVADRVAPLCISQAMGTTGGVRESKQAKARQHTSSRRKT